MGVVAGIIKFMLLNGLTAVAALALASRCRLPARAERVLAATVLFVGVALASSLTLGIAGQLRFWPLLLVQAVIAAAALTVARRDEWAATVPSLRPAQYFTTGSQRVAAAAVGIAYVYVVFLGIVGEPFAGDALMYHLPLVAAYARDGRLTIPVLGKLWNTDLWAYYPGNAYLLYQWWVLPFGSGVLVDLVQLPYAFATALATFVLARTLGARRRAAMWGALLFLAVPIVINQSKTALTDVTASFLVAAGLAFLLSPPLTVPRLLLAAIAWGAAPGVKLTTAFHLLPAAGCVALAVARQRGSRLWLRQLVSVGAVLAAGALLLSGYWYARNYMLTGSPLFPANLLAAQAKVWSNILFYGPLLPLLDFTAYEPMFLYNYETGAGVQFVAFALPASAALALSAWRQRRLDVLCIALLPFGEFVFWVLQASTLFHTIFRFILPVMPVGFAATAWLMQRTARPRALAALATACVGFSVLNAVPHVGTFLAAEPLRSGLVHLVLGTRQLGRFERMGDLAVQDYRRGWAYLDQLSGPHRIAASHLIFSYPMLGADFRHQLHYLEARTREQWLAALHAAAIDHVALAQLTDPRARVEVRAGQLRLDLSAHNTNDEYVGALQALAPQMIRGLRIRYAVPAPTNARVVLGLNRFSDTVELPLNASTSGREHTIEWNGELRSIELLLEFTRRTGLRDELALTVSSLELISQDGRSVALPIDAGQWSRVRWPIEDYWMADDPAHFRLALRDRKVWANYEPSEMRIYEVIHEDSHAPNR